MPSILQLARPSVWFAAVSLITAACFFTVIKTAGISGAPLELVLASRFLRFFLLVSLTLRTTTGGLYSFK